MTLIALLPGALASEAGLYPISDHFDGEHFSNPWGVNNPKTLWDVFVWKISSTPGAWPAETVRNTALPQLAPRAAEAVVTRPQAVHATYIGHATVYLQDGRRNILTDPFFSERASPVSFAGPRRSRRPGIEISQIPALDTVIVSHNHYDHLDLPSLVELDRRFKPRFFVPLGNARHLRSQGISNVTELDWWQEVDGVQLVPAQHWSARGVADRNEALWGGYLLRMGDPKAPTRVYFAGDTGYGPHFARIREKCGTPDLSLLPIGAYEPRWFMKDHHLNPDDAVLAHRDLGSRQSFAIHFETIQMTDEAMEDPRRELRHAIARRKVPAEEFFVPEAGATFILKQAWAVQHSALDAAHPHLHSNRSP